ncbi:urease accessory protein [Brachybacterium vulturis]|uniref:Urease accessory protein UreD n=1 Tax=Brachybacterium vulturis TaxID=2017484 RepID=A0A291GJ90_9MICO|nr:urease accessory protein UreD [Brachybacterium vulturis]ATG50267.1 urease accessory protein [Brachybacterium vulturis]
MTSASSPPELAAPLPAFAQVETGRGRRRTRRGSFLCHAVIATELRAGRTAISRLRADTPLSPRPTIASGEEPFVRGGDAARIRMSASAAGPVGGDTYLLDIHVGAGSTLVLRDVGATLLLPGPHGELSRWVTRLRIDDGATCLWIPEPVIAARGCRHEHVIEAELAAGARLLFREELVLGRHREEPGSLSARLSVRRDGAPTVSQQIDLGPDAAGSRSPSVLGGHRAVGNVVVVDPEGAPGPAAATPDTGSAVMRQDPCTVQISALAADAPALRHRLDLGMDLLGPPWSAAAPRGWSAVPR